MLSLVSLVRGAGVASRRGLSSLPASADCVIVGGGVAGASTAYHLASLGSSCLLLESDKLTSGTTWHSAAMLNTLRSGITEAELCLYTKRLASEVLEAETGQSTGYKRHGGLTVTASPERMIQFQRECDLSRYTGNTGHMVTPGEARDLFPLLDTKGLLGGVYSETDGSVDPTSLTMAYIKGATAKGARVEEGAPVEDILVEDGRVVGVRAAGGQEITTDKVVITAGAWSQLLTQRLGVNLPLVASEHSYIVTDIIPELGENVPNLRVPDDAIYAKIQNQTMFLGAFEANPRFWSPVPGFSFGQFDLDFEAYLPYLEAFSRRIPRLEDVGHRSIICGPESFTPDGMPLWGETREVRGLFLNCVMNSRGIQLSGGLARQLAELMLTGSSSLDMHSYDVKRFPAQLRADKDWCQTKTHERHVKTYHAPIPWDQPLAARGKITSPLHSSLTSLGAFNGVSAGWERPLLFLDNEEMKTLDYDFYGYYGNTRHESYPYRDLLQTEYAMWRPSQRLSEAVRSECQECRQRFVVFDSSSLGKILVTGAEAGAGLEWLCTADIQTRELGHTVYTLMLSDEAGVEADLTVTRIAEDKFYLVTSCAALEHVMHWLESSLCDKDVRVEDVTQDWGVINVQGPQSRNFLKPLIPELENLKFSRSVRVSLGGVDVTVYRLTYVGELGYEIHVPQDTCGHVLDTLFSTVSKVRFAGTEAMESLAVEAGYRHWPADISQIDTPLEAGMGWVCSKTKQFRGRQRMMERQKSPGHKKLISLALDPGALVVGSEPLVCDGAVVGYVRRAETGHVIQKRIVYGYVAGDISHSGDWSVMSGGQLLGAQVIQGSPYRSGHAAL